MPDFNQYSVKEPVQRPEPIIGLSQIVYPKYDYTTTFPETANLDAAGDPKKSQTNTKPFWEDGTDWNKVFGGVPISPGAVTPYKDARRYNRPDIGYLPGRDNEDIYAQNQSFLGSVGSGLGRLVGLTVTKTGTGMGYLAGLVGIDNNAEKYGKGFSAWIAGAGDNAFAKWFDTQEDNIKNEWLPIYKKASEKDHGFFRHMGDLDFWTDDLTDGMAFMASSFIPGMAVSKLRLGANAIKGLNALKGIGYAEEAAALSEEGVSGTVKSAALESQGLGANIESPEIPKTIVSKADATQQIPRALKWIDNAKLARGIDVGTTSVLNTTAQAMYSANDAKNTAYETLIEMKNEDGTPKYSTDQALKLSAKVAKDSYLMNLGALSLMNLWEANFLYKKPSLSNKFTGSGIETSGLFTDAALAKKTFGQRLYNAIQEPGKGFLTAGAWLGNMQLAIDRLNSNPDNFDLDFGDKLSLLTKQYIKQSKDLVVGNDIEAAKALGIGGFMGAVAGKFLGPDEGAEKRKALSELNNRISPFRELGNIYKTDADGKLNMENGTPVIDENKVKSFVASMNNVLSLNQLAKNFETKGIDEMAKIYGDEVFARFAKAHFDAGLSDVLYQKLNDISKISKEDLALLGFDPDSQNETTAQILDRYVKRAKSLEDVHNNIMNNFLPEGINLNTQEGQNKFYSMADKMFYLSARSQTLSELIKSSKDKYERVKANNDSYDEAFNSLTDSIVDKYNELYEKWHSANKAEANFQKKQNYVQELEEQKDLSTKNVAVRDVPSKISRLRKAYPNVEIVLPTYSREEFKGVVDKTKKELDDFVNTNKESLEKLKKDSRGRYLYEVANKNLLPSAKEMERQQIVQAEAGLSRNATLQVMSRLADPKFGVKYYDDVYSKELERHAVEQGAYDEKDAATEEQKKAQDSFYQDPTKDPTKLKSEVDEQQINDAHAEYVETGEVKNKKEIVDHIAEKISKGQALTDHEEDLRKGLSEDVEKKLQSLAEKQKYSELNEQIDDLTKKKEYLESKEDKTLDEESELQKINDQLNSTNDLISTKIENEIVQSKVDNNPNIKVEDKDRYADILKKIAVQKKAITKFDDHYELNGKRYQKVTDLIGDSIPEEQRQDPRTQAAVNSGNTIDSIVKAYFKGNLNDEFKNSIGDKISAEGLDNLVKSLDKIRNGLAADGIEIIDSNVYVVDEAANAIGEIDLLGVDKNGNFKVYEVQARRSDVYRQYGKRGLGIKLRDIDGKRLSMYRNMFANQYGAVPDEIAVKFPVEVKYDKTNPAGFIEGTKLREQLRFQPLKNVEIKLKAPEPLKIGSKFNSVDMTRIFLDTFLPTKEMTDKLKFLFRNLSMKEIQNSLKLTVRKALPQFEEKFELQKKALANEPVDFKIKKFSDYRNRDNYGNPREFQNLYSLVGNTEISLNYEGTPVGFFSPLQTMAYKDPDGTFKILDETTDQKTYSEVTGNDPSTYDEFRRVALSYKKLYTTLTNKMLESPNKEVTLSPEEIKQLFDIRASAGELDLLRKNDPNRPDLKDLAFSGIKVGAKAVPTVVNVDSNDSVKVFMDKGRKNLSVLKKYQDVDRWANAHLNEIKEAMHDRDGNKITDNVAIVEDATGNYRIVSLKAKEKFDPNQYDDFVDNLGSKFTAATSKGVFKSENLMIVPKAEETINIGLKDKIINSLYPAEDPSTIEKFTESMKTMVQNNPEAEVDEFLNSDMPDQLKQDLEDLGLTTKDAIMADFVQGDWPDMKTYLDNLRNC